MAPSIQAQGLIVLLVAMASTTSIANGSDPDILTDYLPLEFPLPPPPPDGNYFTFMGMRPLVTIEPPKTFTAFRASASEFPALNGQGVSIAVLLYPSGSSNGPHVHPRASEILFLLDGELQVGFVDTSNRLYKQVLQPGDMFVFPKGLVHYQFCSGKNPAVAISAFGSASAGTVSIPGSMFMAGIDDNILANSFRTDVETIKKIKTAMSAPMS